MERYFDTALNNRGEPSVGLTVTVTDSNGAVATLYSDNGVTQMDNPFYTDKNGAFYFYAANGRYTVSLTADGVAPASIKDVILLDPEDRYLGDSLLAGQVSADLTTYKSDVANTANGKGADLVANATKKVVSIAALRALRIPQGSDAQTAIVDGGSSANDGLGGDLIWDATDTSADDGLNVIEPNSAPAQGRWNRLKRFIQNVTGAIARSVLDKLRDTLSARDFGAVGDGVADDTAALQKAFDWLGNGPFRTLEFTHGAKHKVTATLTMTSTWTSRQCTVIGNGAQLISYVTGTNANGQANPLLDLSASAISSFSDLTLNTNTAGTGTAVYARPGTGQYAGQSIFKTVNILNFDTGIYWGSATAGANGGWSTNFIDCDVSSCTTGVHLADGGNNALVFLGARIASNTIGVLIDGNCHGVKFLGGAVESNSTAAVRLGGTTEKHAISFDGVYFENGVPDFDILTNTTNINNLSVKNCYITSSANSKIGPFNTGTGVSATGVSLRDNFVYFSGTGASYGNVPDGAVLENNSSSFEQSVGGNNLVFPLGRSYNIPTGAPGALVNVGTEKTTIAAPSFTWTLLHANNDGNYVFSGVCVVTQSGVPVSNTLIAEKSSGAAAAGGTITWDTTGGSIRFNYTPPAGVTTNAGTTLVIR